MRRAASGQFPPFAKIANHSECKTAGHTIQLYRTFVKACRLRQFPPFAIKTGGMDLSIPPVCL